MEELPAEEKDLIPPIRPPLLAAFAGYGIAPWNNIERARKPSILWILKRERPICFTLDTPSSTISPRENPSKPEGLFVARARECTTGLPQESNDPRKRTYLSCEAYGTGL